MRTLLCLVVSWSLSYAQEETPEGEEEAPKSVEAGAEQLASESQPDTDWTKQITKLNSKSEKVAEYKRIIKKMIKEKNSAQTKEQKHQIIAKMLDVHNRLKKAITEYNELAPVIKYRFPAKGRAYQRQYVPEKLQSIEQMEKEMGLDYDLTHLRQLVQRKYSTMVKDETKIERDTAGSFTQKEADQAVTKKRIRLER